MKCRTHRTELYPGARDLPFAEDDELKRIMRAMGRPMSFDEIAAVLGISRQAVDLYFYSALRKLRLGVLSTDSVRTELREMRAHWQAIDAERGSRESDYPATYDQGEDHVAAVGDWNWWSK